MIKKIILGAALAVTGVTAVGLVVIIKKMYDRQNNLVEGFNTLMNVQLYINNDLMNTVEKLEDKVEALENKKK